jgi:hypothetical protein
MKGFATIIIRNKRVITLGDFEVESMCFDTDKEFFEVNGVKNNEKRRN